MHSLIYPLPHFALTRFSWLQVKGTQLKLFEVRKGNLLVHVPGKSKSSTGFPHWGLKIMSPSVCLSSSSFPSSFLLLLFLSFPFSLLLPLIFPSFSQAFSLRQVKELPAALKKHASSLATPGREVVYCWSQPKISPGGLWSGLCYTAFLETNFCHLTFGIVWLARLGMHGQGGECKGSSSAPSNHKKCVQDTEET